MMAAASDAADAPSIRAIDAPSIRAIDAGSVHRICSGQVVVDLAVAVKELLENALDANATTVDIRLKEYGMDMIEVTDNGSGIDETNYETLALKHYTSKLARFEDLTELTSFGFRGEALSSLCAIAELTVCTRVRSQPMGVRLSYDANGRLTAREPAAREPGTTITLRRLFEALPVRSREFKKNIKREYGKCVALIQAYALVCVGVRLSCSLQVGKGARTPVVATEGGASLRDNISSVLGVKMLQTLTAIDMVCHHESGDVKLSGFISRGDHRQGRTANDRQYFYLNGRPVELPKIAKSINEVYHQFNMHQYPVVILNFVLPTDAYDVNVTPDKRTVFVHAEKAIIEQLKVYLDQLLSPSMSTFTVNNRSSMSLNSFFSSSSRDDDEEKRGNGPSLDATPPDDDVEGGHIMEATPTSLTTPTPTPSTPASPAAALLMPSLKHTLSAPAAVSVRRERDETPEPTDDFVPASQHSDTTASLSRSPVKRARTESAIAAPAEVDSDRRRQLLQMDLKASGTAKRSKLAKLMANRAVVTSSAWPWADEDSKEVSPAIVPTGAVAASENTADEAHEHAHADVDEGHGCSHDHHHHQSTTSAYDDRHNSPATTAAAAAGVVLEPTPAPEDISFDASMLVFERDSVAHEQQPPHMELPALLSSVSSSSLLATVTVDASVERMTRILLQRKQLSKDVSNESAKSDIASTRFFQATLGTAAATREDEAQSELTRSIAKADFAKMRVLGQFNRGFIIAWLDNGRGGDLFIVDQHATDEKYNFETLQKTTIISTQVLLRPLSLDLAATDEMVIMDNVDIFRRNGFDFVIDPEALVGQRVKLKQQPYSRSTTFGIRDIEELVYLLSDRPGEMVRCSRLRSMFASYACRKSVMIGDALNLEQMRRLVQHMGEIDQPWNCPHGRPTMRHLFDLARFPDKMAQSPAVSLKRLRAPSTL